MPGRRWKTCTITPLRRSNWPRKAKGILVFPSIVKGGLVVGGQYGDGALLKNDKVVGYYNTVAGSYGLQAGVQKFGYAMFFMNDSSLAYLDKSRRLGNRRWSKYCHR